MCKFFKFFQHPPGISKRMFGIFISQRISVDGISVFSIGFFFFIVQLLEKSVTAKEEMELDLFGKVRFSYFMSH